MKSITSYLFILILFASCNNNNGYSGGGYLSSNSNTQKSPEELKRELKMQEHSAPLTYLSVTGTTMTPNKIRDAGLFHGAEYDGYMVEGTVRSTATLARFKDAVITLQFLSQTQTVVDSKDYVIYEFFEPNSSKHFSFKVNPPNVTAQYKIILKSATAVN